MTSRRKYLKPPVVEALCEIYFAGSAWDDTVPGRFYDRIKADFTDKRQQEIHEAEVSFTAAGEAAAGVRRLSPRMQFATEKGDRMIQLGRDLLVVNQLRPYPRFDDWEPIIYRSLELYRELAQPKEITRLGLRYINRVIIPLPRIRMEDYFTVYPHLPASMGEEHGAFMVRFELPRQKGGHTVLVTFGSAPADKPGEIAHLLDFYDILRPSQTLSFESIQQEVRTAHDNIETAFEGSITGLLRALFKPEG
jgi:uncharacterized protein (TIGR04255 family)